MRIADEEVGSSLTLETAHMLYLESAAILKTLEERLLHRDRLYSSIILSRKGSRAHEPPSGTAVALGLILNDRILKTRAPSVGTYSYNLGLGEYSESNADLRLLGNYGGCVAGRNTGETRLVYTC